MSLKSSAGNTAIYDKTKLHQLEGTKVGGSTGPTGPTGPYAKTTAITDSLVPYSTTALTNTAYVLQFWIYYRFGKITVSKIRVRIGNRCFRIFV